MPHEREPHKQEPALYRKIERTPHGMLPETPVGQYPVENVITATRSELENALREVFGVEPQALFKEKVYEGLESPSAERRYWNMARCLRLALLYIEATPYGKITEYLAKAEPQGKTVTEKDVRDEVALKLSALAKGLAEETRITRKWHALMHPTNPQTEEYLKRIEARFGIDRRAIFHMPEEKKTALAQGDRNSNILPNPDAEGEDRGMHSLDILVQALYLYNYEGKSRHEVAQEISRELGRNVKESDVSSVFSRAITSRADNRFRAYREE